jgi:hypothetical protein
MRKLIVAIATVTLLLAGSLVWKAEAAMTTGVGGLAPLTKAHTPAESVGYYYRRGYYGWRRPYYGYGYRRPYYGYGYYGWRRPYYGYGSYYGRRWRY